MKELVGLRAALLVGLLMLAALGARLWTIGYGLPFSREADAQAVEQLRALESGPIADEDAYRFSAYPLLLARAAHALGLGREPEVDPVNGTLDEHLAAAGALHLRVRILVACVSVLLVFGTWRLARTFCEPSWALFATALVTTSMLALQFGRMARPHAVAAPFLLLATVEWMRFAARGAFASLCTASASTALALAALPNGFAALLPAAAAWWLAPRRPKWALDARLWVPLALVALAIRFAYPFWFVAWPDDPDAKAGVGAVRFGWHQGISPSEFTGGGFRVLAWTFGLYEPVASVLACAALVCVLLRLRGGALGRRVRELAPETRRALGVALAFGLPYALVLGLYSRTQQRFGLPLVPFVALGAALGARELRRLARTGVSRALTSGVLVAALVVPSGAVVRESLERAREHPLEGLARWIETHVERSTQRVALHVYYDVPLARTRAHFAPRAGLDPEHVGPWLAYQKRHLVEQGHVERWRIDALYPDARTWPAIEADPDAYVRSLDVDFVVVPCGGERLDVAPASAVRDALRRSGSLVFAVHERDDHPSLSDAEREQGWGRFRFLLGETTAPELEVWRLERVAPAR